MSRDELFQGLTEGDGTDIQLPLKETLKEAENPVYYEFQSKSWGVAWCRGSVGFFLGKHGFFHCFRRGLCPLVGTWQQAGDVLKELQAAGCPWADASAIGGALWHWLSFCSGLGCFRPSTCSAVLRVALPGTPGIQQLEPHGRETLVGAPLLDTAPDVELSLP